MKKTICALTTAVLCAVMSVTAFAASPITAVNGTDSAEVKGTYVEGSSSDTVYSVDVAWDSMEFTYTAEKAGIWNPETHTYEGTVPAKWSETNNKITVTNHSNVAVDATLTYTAESVYSSISGSFTNANGVAISNILPLETAYGTTVANAPIADAFLKLDGALSEGLSNTKIGTVTVTITQHFEIG